MSKDWKTMSKFEKNFITSLSKAMQIPRRLIVTNVPLHLRIYDMRYRP